MFGDRRAIAVEIDSPDRLTWGTRRQLVELVAELHPDRHEPVAGAIRERIGKVSRTGPAR